MRPLRGGTEVLDAYLDYKTLEIAQESRLLTVSLNRPESLNAVDAVMHEELQDLWWVVGRDMSVGAVFLRGNGRSFCAGGDMRHMGNVATRDVPPSAGERATDLLVDAQRIVTGMLELQQPIVCAAQGHAMGIGATLALCSDVLVVAEDAIIADNHVSAGLVAGDGGTLIWPLLLPLNIAKYYLLTGDRIAGRDAVQLGLAIKAVPAAELDRTAGAIATKLAAGPSMAIRFTKAAVNKVARERANLLFDTSLILEAATFCSQDHAEATAAFVEKREPVFKGR
jgi:enoyl-CoA hydratase